MKRAMRRLKACFLVGIQCFLVGISCLCAIIVGEIIVKSSYGYSFLLSRNISSLRAALQVGTIRQRGALLREQFI